MQTLVDRPLVKPISSSAVGPERPTIMLMISVLGVGGAERHTVALANLLAERFRVVLVYIKNDRSIIDATIEDQVRPEVAEVLALNAGSGFDRQAMRRLADAVDRLQPDAIVCANTLPLIYAQLLRLWSRHRPRVVEVFHTTVLQSWRERLHMFGFLPLFWASHRLIYVCEAQRSYWKRRGLRARHVSVVHNGIDTERFRPEPFVEAARARRQQYGFGPDDLVVGICAVLRSEKAHVHLLQAMAQSRSQRWKALLIGEGPMRTIIEREAQRLGLEGRVVITGYQSDVRADIAACDVMALVSVAIETFSIAALEAMAMGKPMIMSDVGGAREQVVPGSTGWIFAAGDTTALARCLDEAAAEPAKLLSMGAQARQRVLRDYSVATMVHRYEELLLADTQKVGAGRLQAAAAPRHGDAA